MDDIIIENDSDYELNELLDFLDTESKNQFYSHIGCDNIGEISNMLKGRGYNGWNSQNWKLLLQMIS